MVKKIAFLYCILISFSTSAKTESIFRDTIFISLSDSDFQAMERMRKDILLLGDKQNTQLKRKEYQSYLTCQVSYNGLNFSSQIRMKGDRMIHYEDGDVSYRVKLNGSSGIMGMKKFSLQKPRSKNYLYESFFHKALIREDIIGLRYIFIRLFINNKDVGIYAMEEFMDKKLIKHAKRKDGPILHFSEDISAENLSLMEPEVFGKAPADKEGKARDKKALKLLGDFKNKKVKVSETFDIQRLGTFFALTDILGFHHGAVAKSLRFYYNPDSSKFEPIGFDGHYGTENGIYISAELGINPNAEWFYYFYKEWFSILFSNPKTFDGSFFSSYLRSLKRVCEKKYLDKLFADLDSEMQSEMELLATDLKPNLADHIFSFGPDTFKFSKVRIYERQAAIRELISPVNRIKAIILKHSKDSITIGIRNTERLPVEFLSIICDGKRVKIPPYSILPANNWVSDTLYSPLKVSVPHYNSKKELKIEYWVQGLDDIKTENVTLDSYGTIRDSSLIVSDTKFYNK